MRKRGSAVYCPGCGEAAEAGLLYCPKCGESLKGAPEADPHEYRRRKRRLKAAERREKRNALFNRHPVLRPLSYILAGLAAVGVTALLWKTATVSTLLLLITIAVLIIPLYIWYAGYVLNNLGCFSSRKVENLHFGAVFGGLLLIISLIYMIVMLMMQ